MHLEIKISDWQAIAPGLSSNEDWALWARSGQRDAAPPSCDLVPLNLRRRMSLPSKYAVHIALSLASRHQVDYAIFASRHGELQRTYHLLNEILSGEEASPIAFSQSVHNTASGLFTIAAQSNLPVTSLAACEDSFGQGLLEAYARIKTAAGKRLLFVCFDEIVPDVYSAFVDEEVFSYAVGLLLELGDDWTIDTQEKASPDIGPKLPQALEFLKHFINRDREFIVCGRRYDWSWVCMK